LSKNCDSWPKKAREGLGDNITKAVKDLLCMVAEDAQVMKINDPHQRKDHPDGEKVEHSE
jgi:hypothetical protein